MLTIDNTTVLNANVVINDSANSIALDYSLLYLRIAVALENLTAATRELSNNTANVVTKIPNAPADPVSSQTLLAVSNNICSNISVLNSSLQNITYSSYNQSNNLIASIYSASNSAFNQSNNLVASVYSASNSSYNQSNNLIASVYTVANTANVNSVDLMTVLGQLVSNTEILSNNSVEFIDLAAGRTNSGVRIISPWEWLSMSSIVKIYAEEGADLAALKRQVDALPKSV